MLKIDLDPCQACTCIVQIGLVEHSLRIHLELPAEAQRLAGDACSARKQTVRQIQASCHSTMYRKRDRERERERERERGYESLQRSGWNCDGRSEDGVLALSQRGRGLWLQTVGLSALESTARSSLDTNALCAVFWMGRCCFSIFCCNLLQVLPTAYTERGCACHIFFREMPCLAEDPCSPPPPQPTCTSLLYFLT